MKLFTFHSMHINLKHYAFTYILKKIFGEIKFKRFYYIFDKIIKSKTFSSNFISKI